MEALIPNIFIDNYWPRASKVEVGEIEMRQSYIKDNLIHSFAELQS